MCEKPCGYMINLYMAEKTMVFRYKVCSVTGG